jgi:hypothetical protein
MSDVGHLVKLHELSPLREAGKNGDDASNDIPNLGTTKQRTRKLGGAPVDA